MTSTYQDSYQGIVDAFNTLRLANGEERRAYDPNYQGIIQAIVDLKRWGQSGNGEVPPGWEPVFNDGSIEGVWNPPPQNGTLWFDTRQGRLFIWMDDGFYQTNGADGVPALSADPPTSEIPGSLWYNTNTGTLYIWDGSSWTALTAPTGFNTGNLLLSNPTTTSFTGQSTTLPAIAVTTQEGYNQWLFNALKALEVDLEAVVSVEPLDMGTTNPTNATDGDFFYDTAANTLLVYSSGTWYPATPYPDISSDASITALQTADTGLATDIQTVQTNLDNAVATLQALPHLTYDISTVPNSTGVNLMLADSNNVQTNIPFAGTGGIAISQAGAGINVDASTLQTAITAIEADYLTAADLSPLTAEDSALAYDITQLEATVQGHTTSITNAQNAIAALPSIADVQARLSLAGGALTGQLDMGGNRISNLPTPTASGDATPKSYVDTMDTSIRNSHIARNNGVLTSVLINNTNTDKAALDFSGNSTYSDDAFKFRTNSPAGNDYVTFGTSSDPYEYSWRFASDEAFNWIYNGQRVFAIQGNNAYAQDLVLCSLAANAAGPLYNNPISVRTTLSNLETTTATHTTEIAALQLSASSKNIYYSDAAPTANLTDGDLWFDSYNLRLNVRHGGFWVFPDRVEDVALKSALHNAVNTSTDYASLKTNLLAALS